MKEIIKDRPEVYYCECQKCMTIFTYTYEDIIVASDREYDQTVTCPRCGYSNSHYINASKRVKGKVERNKFIEAQISARNKAESIKTKKEREEKEEENIKMNISKIFHLFGG